MNTNTCRECGQQTDSETKLAVSIVVLAKLVNSASAGKPTSATAVPVMSIPTGLLHEAQDLLLKYYTQSGWDETVNVQTVEMVGHAVARIF